MSGSSLGFLGRVRARLEKKAGFEGRSLSHGRGGGGGAEVIGIMIRTWVEPGFEPVSNIIVVIVDIAIIGIIKIIIVMIIIIIIISSSLEF